MFTFFFLLLTCTSAAIDGLRKQKQKQKLCSRKLQLALYQPQICGQDYLNQLERKLRFYQPLLFTDQRDSIIAGFEQQYGVKVTIRDPFSRLDSIDAIECDSFTPGFVPIGGTLTATFSETNTGPFFNASLTGFTTSSGAQVTAINVTSPSGTQQIVYNNICPSGFTIDTNFADNGVVLTSATPACANALINSAGTIKPVDLFSTFSGEQVQGTWTVTVVATATNNPSVSFFLNVCYNTIYDAQAYYSRDIAYSNLNLPAFSRENGISKLTSIYRNTYDDMIYVTISSDSLICK